MPRVAIEEVWKLEFTKVVRLPRLKDRRDPSSGFKRTSLGETEVTATGFEEAEELGRKHCPDATTVTGFTKDAFGEWQWTFTSPGNY